MSAKKKGGKGSRPAAPPTATPGGGQQDTSKGVPPFSDTGGTVTWAGVHWFTGTTSTPPLEVVSVLSKHFHGLLFEERPSSRFMYEHGAFEVGTGAYVLWGGKHDRAAVFLPGAACEMLGQAGLLDLARELGLRPTRIDLAWDTPDLTPHMVRDAHEAGQTVTFTKYTKWIQEKGVKDSGNTFYLGKRADSDARLVRFYDRRGPTRVELEVHGKRAVKLWELLGGLDLERWSDAGLAYLVDFVDIRDRSADANVGRCPRLPWWEDFCAGAKRISLPIPRKAPTLESQQAWVEGQVAPTLALVADAMANPEAYIRSVLAGGRDRRSDHQAALLSAVTIKGLTPTRRARE